MCLLQNLLTPISESKRSLYYWPLRPYRVWIPVAALTSSPTTHWLCFHHSWNSWFSQHISILSLGATVTDVLSAWNAFPKNNLMAHCNLLCSFHLIKLGLQQYSFSSALIFFFYYTSNIQQAIWCTYYFYYLLAFFLQEYKLQKARISYIFFNFKILSAPRTMLSNEHWNSQFQDFCPQLYLCTHTCVYTIMHTPHTYEIVAALMEES